VSAGTSLKTFCSFSGDDLQKCITKHEAIAIHPSSAKWLQRKSQEQISLKGIHLHHSLSLAEQLGLSRPFYMLPAHLATIHRNANCGTHLSATIGLDFILIFTSHSAGFHHF
jgi:hypothetical protein